MAARKSANPARKTPADASFLETSLLETSWLCTLLLLDHFSGGWLRLQLDLAEGLLILRDVLVQNIRQSLRLRRAQVHAMMIQDVDAVGPRLVHGAEQEEKIPKADADLHAIGVVFAIVGSVGELDLGWRLLWIHICFGSMPIALDRK